MKTQPELVSPLQVAYDLGFGRFIYQNRLARRDKDNCGTPAQRTGLPVFPTQRSCLLETLNNLEQNIAELLSIIVGYKLIYYMIIEAKSTSSAATISTLFI
jgi:hypothetical protein